MRVLVSFEERHHAYSDAIARAIGCSWTRLGYRGSESFADEVSRLHPEVVISDRRKEPGVAAAWVQLPAGPNPVSRICVGGRCRSSRNLSLAELLSVMGEAEEMPGSPDATGVNQVRA